MSGVARLLEEAAAALARGDAGRLDEIGALLRARGVMAHDMEGVVRQRMRVLERVVAATRSNLRLIEQLSPAADGARRETYGAEGAWAR